MFDRNEQHTTEFNQTHNGPGDNVRDKYIINNYLGSVDYQHLVQDIEDTEELLAGIALSILNPFPSTCQKKLNSYLKQEMTAGNSSFI